MPILRSISEGFKLSISAKRIIPYLITNLVLFYLVIIFMWQLIDFALLETNPLTLLGSLGTYFIIFIIIIFVQLWITGAITYQAKYPNKSLIDSFEYSTSKFLVMIASAILSGLIGIILSMPQYIGWLLSIVWSMITFYLYPSIIIGGRSVINSFKESWHIFWKSPLETFVTWLLIMIIGLIIITIFTLPIIFYFIGGFLNLFSMDDSIYINDTITKNLIKTEILPKIMDAVNSPIFLVYFFIFCLGVSIQRVFSDCAVARLYINLRKGKKISEEEF